MCDDCTSGAEAQKRTVQIKLPRETLDLPIKQRAEIVTNLAKSLGLKTDLRAQTADLMDGFGHEVSKIWMAHDHPLVSELEERIYQEFAVPLWHCMLDVFDVLGLEPPTALTVTKSMDDAEAWYVQHHMDLIKSEGPMDMDKVNSRYKKTPYQGDGQSFTSEQLQTLDSVMKRYGADTTKLMERIAVMGTYLGRLIEAFEGDNERLRRGITELLPVTFEARQTIDQYALTQKEADRTGLPLLPLQQQEENEIRWYAEHGALKIGEISDKQRTQIRALVVNARRNRLSPKQIEQLLFDKFGELNRDLRRIALTEVAEATNNGYLMGLTHSQPLTILGADNACPFCKSMQGKEYTFVDPAQVAELDWDNMIWIGKSNYGRKGKDMKACCPAHPHCRDRYVKYNPKFQKIDGGRIAIKSRDEIVGDAIKAKMEE